MAFYRVEFINDRYELTLKLLPRCETLGGARQLYELAARELGRETFAWPTEIHCGVLEDADCENPDAVGRIWDIASEHVRAELAKYSAAGRTVVEWDRLSDYIQKPEATS